MTLPASQRRGKSIIKTAYSHISKRYLFKKCFENQGLYTGKRKNEAQIHNVTANDKVWPLRLGHKRHRGWCLALINHSLGGRSATMLWGSSQPSGKAHMARNRTVLPRGSTSLPAVGPRPHSASRDWSPDNVLTITSGESLRQDNPAKLLLNFWHTESLWIINVYCYLNQLVLRKFIIQQ